MVIPNLAYRNLPILSDNLFQVHLYILIKDKGLFKLKCVYV